MKRLAAVGLVFGALVSGCSSPLVTPGPGSSDPQAFTTCRDAFAAWVGGSGTLNTPGTDALEMVVAMERVQRRVFEVCSLAEAEALNRELQIQETPEVRRPLIEPDIRTFAEVECVDESPLLDGTALCAEVGR